MFRFIKRLFCRRSSPLEKHIGYSFNNPAYLIQALTHPSYVGENNGSRMDSYERLEFLGDAVLNFVVSDYLYKKYPQFNEGELTERRRILVSGKALADIANKLGIAEHIRYSYSSARELENGHPSVLADVYEAIVGAIYLDGGFVPVRKFLERFHLKEEDALMSSRKLINFKGRLLEFLQAQGSSPPEYKLERVLGPEHRRYYIISAWSEGKFLGLGGGFSRKEAEQQAAERALLALLKEEG